MGFKHHRDGKALASCIATGAIRALRKTSRSITLSAHKSGDMAPDFNMLADDNIEAEFSPS